MYYREAWFRSIGMMLFEGLVTRGEVFWSDLIR